MRLHCKVCVSHSSKPSKPWPASVCIGAAARTGDENKKQGHVIIVTNKKTNSSDKYQVGFIEN